MGFVLYLMQLKSASVVVWLRKPSHYLHIVLWFYSCELRQQSKNTVFVNDLKDIPRLPNESERELQNTTKNKHPLNNTTNAHQSFSQHKDVICIIYIIDYHIGG